MRRSVFLSGSWDDSIKLWDLQHPGSLSTFSGHTYCVYAAVWCARGRVRQRPIPLRRRLAPRAALRAHSRAPLQQRQRWEPIGGDIWRPCSRHVPHACECRAVEHRRWRASAFSTPYPGLLVRAWHGRARPTCGRLAAQEPRACRRICQLQRRLQRQGLGRAAAGAYAQHPRAPLRGAPGPCVAMLACAELAKAVLIMMMRMRSCLSSPALPHNAPSASSCRNIPSVC